MDMTFPNQGIPQPSFQQPNFPQHTQPFAPPQAQPGPQVQQPQAQAGPAPVRGSLGAGWDQGSRAGGYGAFVKFPTENHRFQGVVARELTDSDCTQVIDPGTKQPKFFKSGTPQLKFLIAVNVQPSADFPDGKATLSTDKYKLHSAVIRAMQEQGYQPGEGLHEGDQIVVDRLQDVRSGMGNPSHEFAAYIQRGAGAPVQDPTVASVPAVQETTAPAVQTSPTATTSAPAQAPANQDAGVTATDDLTPNGNRRIPGLTDVQSDMVAQYGATAQ